MSDLTIRVRWQAKLRARLALKAYADKAVGYWVKRRNKAKNPSPERRHARLMLADRRKLAKLRRDQVAAARRVIARHSPVASTSTWHPKATRVAGRDAGSFIAVPARIVWHTTEGSSAEGAIAAYRATGSWPHFTFDPRTGKLFQHLPVNVAARALMHPSGVPETNRAHAVQVELVGFAKETAKWPTADYARIAGLARWLEANTGAKRRSGLEFSTTPHRMTNGDWLAFSGHCGHQHVPGNEHWDPGAFRIDRIL